MNLLPLHSVFFVLFFDFNEICSGNCELLLQATDSNENQILDGSVYARWSKNAKYCFYRKSAEFSNGDYCSQNCSCQLQTGFNQTLKGSKCIPQNHCMFLIVKSNGEINMNFRWNFENVNFCIFRPTGIHGTV